MSDAEIIRRAVEEDCELVGRSFPVLVAEIKRLRVETEARLERARAAYDACRETLEVEHDRALLAESERDAILRWSIRHAGYIGTRIDDDGLGSWWTSGDDGRVFAATPEQAVRKAAGLDAKPADWSSDR